MKRAAAPNSAWGRVAERMGVEPKKLAVLVAVAGGAIVLLAGKMLLGGPSKASAKTAPPSSAASATPAAPGAAAPAAVPGRSEATGARAGGTAPIGGRADDDGTVIEVRLDTQPRRDPFAPFIERPKANARTAADAPADSSITPPDFSVFRLRATMDGEWVVINDQTLRVGDTIGLGPDGTPIKLVEVAHRRAAVEWRGRRFDLEFLR